MLLTRRKRRRMARISQIISVVPGAEERSEKSMNCGMMREHSSPKLRQTRANRKKQLEMMQAQRQRRFENEQYDRKSDVAAALVQGLFRAKGNMTFARMFRANMKANVADRAQFAQTVTWGIEGMSFQVGVTRAHRASAERLHLRVVTVDHTAVEGRDYLLQNDSVIFEPGAPQHSRET